MLLYVPIVYGFLPEINIFVFEFVCVCRIHLWCNCFIRNIVKTCLIDGMPDEMKVTIITPKKGEL